MKHKLLIALILFVFWLLLFIPNTKAEAPEQKLQDKPIQDIIVHFAKENGVDPKIALAVARCESQFGTLPDGDSGNAKGVWQYWDDTWERHYKDFHKETGVTLSKGSKFDDTRLAMWAFANNKASEWSTFVALKKGGTYSFYSKALKKHFTVTCKM